MSFLVPTKIHLASDPLLTDAATSAKRSGNQRFAGPYSAPGQIPIEVWDFALEVRGKAKLSIFAWTSTSAPQSSAIRKKRIE